MDFVKIGRMENLDHFNFESCDALRLAHKKVVSVFFGAHARKSVWRGTTDVFSCPNVVAYTLVDGEHFIISVGLNPEPFHGLWRLPCHARPVTVVLYTARNNPSTAAKRVFNDFKVRKHVYHFLVSQTQCVATPKIEIPNLQIFTKSIR